MIVANKTRLLVFAKAPRAGSVKTRLIPLLGGEGAAVLHARLTEYTMATAGAAGIGPVDLIAAPADDTFLIRCAARHGAGLLPQSEGDLGTRMHAAFMHAFETAAAVLLIGTDCPVLTAEHLREAARVLELGRQAVFIPAEDGGYALIGLRQSNPRLFESIDWSTERVMEQTRQRLRELAWTATELETLWDVDRPADYLRAEAGGLFASENPTAVSEKYRPS